MQYKLTGKNLEITSAMENILDRKLTKLDKLFDGNAVAYTVMSMEKGRSYSSPRSLPSRIPSRPHPCRDGQRGSRK